MPVSQLPPLNLVFSVVLGGENEKRDLEGKTNPFFFCEWLTIRNNKDSMTSLNLFLNVVST